jgi:hypothetical protein
MGHKKLAVIISFFFTFSVFSQECGTVLPPDYMSRRMTYNQLQSASSALLPHDTCFMKELSIVFYVFLDSLGTNNVTPASINSCVSNLNKYFKPLCIKFLSCSTKTIPEYEYNQWDRPNHEFKIVGNFNYHTDKTINIYLVDNIVVPGGANGYADMPPGNVIVLKKSALGGLTPVHEMGHFFGLPHTFETTVPAELVRRTNCYTSGDMFCDTDADPYPTGSAPTTPCGFLYGPADTAGDYFIPPVDNIMSYWDCRCRFTQEQYNYMAWIYITARAYLH